MTIRLITAGTLLFCASYVAAAPVTVPFTFTAGTAAKASEVNANFTALANAINQLSSRVSQLESGKYSLTESNFIGTYTMHGLITMLPNPTYVAKYIESRVVSGTMTINADHTYSVSESESGFKHDVTDTTGSASAIGPYTGGHNGTWSLSAGILQLDGDTVGVGGGGTVLTSNYTEADSREAGVFIFTRN